MPALTNLGTWTRPNSVSIFAQDPGRGFVAFAINLAPVPIAGRARLDLAETEDYSRRYSISRHPVERVIAQNKIREPDQLTLVGMLSAHPLLSPLDIAGIARLDKRELKKLLDLIDRQTPLYIVTPERRYPNMVCVSHQERYDESTGEGVALTLSFEEIQIVSPGLVESVLDLDDLGIGTGASADLGPQTPETVTQDPLSGSALSSTEKASIVAETPDLAGVLL